MGWLSCPQQIGFLPLRRGRPLRPPVSHFLRAAAPFDDRANGLVPIDAALDLQSLQSNMRSAGRDRVHPDERRLI